CRAPPSRLRSCSIQRGSSHFLRLALQALQRRHALAMSCRHTCLVMAQLTGDLVTTGRGYRGCWITPVETGRTPDGSTHLIETPPPHPHPLPPRQSFAFHPSQKRPPGCRHVGKTLPAARRIERRHGIATARDRHKVAGLRQFRGGFGYLNRTIVKRFHLERPERAIPDQRLYARQHGNHVLDGTRTDVEYHLIRCDGINGGDG